MGKIKIKTHKATAKRFGLTKSGKVKYSHMHRRHQVNLKDQKRMRHLKKGAYLSEANADIVKRLIPYK